MKSINERHDETKQAVNQAAHGCAASPTTFSFFCRPAQAPSKRKIKVDWFFCFLSLIWFAEREKQSINCGIVGQQLIGLVACLLPSLRCNSCRRPSAPINSISIEFLGLQLFSLFNEKKAINNERKAEIPFI